jgi:hypothetical protein
MAINSRTKGAKAERVAAKVIEKWTGKKFAKTPASGGLGWKKANVAGDIVCTTEGVFFPFCVEIKSYSKIDFSHLLTPGIKNIEILDFWAQCSRDAEKAGKIPLLMMRYNGLPKEFFYVVTTQGFAKEIHPILALGHPGMVSLRYHNYKTNVALMIMRSDEFFRSDYKPIKKIAKTIIRGRKK